MPQNRIRELRKERGISQAALAKMVGVAQNTLSYWENGKYDIDNSSLTIMADYFGVTLDYILGRDIQFALHDGENVPFDNDLLNEVSSFAEYAKTQKKKAPSKDEAELSEFMKLYEKLTPEHRAVLLAAAKGFAQEK